MSTHLSLKIHKGTMLALLAALVFVAAIGATLATQSALASRPQGRGRIMTARQPAAPSEQIVLDDEAQAALASAFDGKTIRFEVAENGTKFTFDETPVFADGLPAFGGEFITEGYIYPAGTLNGANGVNPDGSPEFPNRVIGRWICRGWHVGEGAHTTTGPWVITHQLYDFGGVAGRVTIATDGLELPELNIPIHRAITGGTGPFALARGEVVQTLLAFPNNAFGVNLRYEARVASK